MDGWMDGITVLEKFLLTTNAELVDQKGRQSGGSNP
ncbi:hypothetical protein L345_07624, partial [Ophiophagus hannah]